MGLLPQRDFPSRPALDLVQALDLLPLRGGHDRRAARVLEAGVWASPVRGEVCRFGGAGWGGDVNFSFGDCFPLTGESCATKWWGFLLDGFVL